MRRNLMAVLSVLLIACSVSFGQPATQPSRERGGAGGAAGGPRGLLERIQQTITDLKLSDEQREKVDAIVIKAREEAGQIAATLREMSPQERQMRVREFVAGIREQITPILSDEQREIFEQRLQALRGGAGGNAKPNAPAPNANDGAGAMLRRLREAAGKLELSDEQKEKIEAIFTQVQEDFRKLRAEAAGDAQALREKARAMFDESREKIRNVLTPEQQEKLRELMTAGDDGTDRARRDREPSPPQMDKPNPEPKSDPPATQPSGSGGGGALAAPQPGQMAPALAIKKLDGSSVQLSSFEGRLVLLAFGSYSSPSFRQRAESLEQLRKEFGQRVNFVLVYTKEAHPEGEWDVQRNRTDDIKVPAQKDEADRKRFARDAASRLKLNATLTIDDMDDVTASAYRAHPNNAAVLIGKDGKILAYQQWFDAYRMRDAIQSALAERSSSSSAATR